jgi:hypothetical protein
MAALICTLPCRLCNEGCKIFGSTCSCAFGGCFKALAKSCKSPFCFFGTVATVLNLPPIASALSIVPSAVSYGTSVTGCQGLLWLSVNFALCVVNIAAAWYFAATVVSKNTADPDMPSKAFERATRMICYDPWIALYLIIGIGFIIWQGIGSAWFTLNSTTGGGGSCPNGLTQAWSTALAFGWAYIFTGGLALCIGFCCASCDKNEYGGQPEEFYVTPEQQRSGHVPSVMERQPELEQEHELELQPEADIETGKKSQKRSFFSSSKTDTNRDESQNRAETDIPMATAVVIGSADAPSPATAPVIATAPRKGDEGVQNSAESPSGNDFMSSATKAAEKAKQKVMKQVDKMKQARVD